MSARRPATTMALASLLSFYLCFVLSSQSLSTFGDAMEDTLVLGHASLNEMFREVEMLMEDTQQILEEAVDQMASESAKSSRVDPDQPGPDSHGPPGTSAQDRDPSVGRTDRLRSESENRTEETSSLETLSRWNDVGYECIVDEDCGDLSFCLYEVVTSKCFPCRSVDMTCTTDNECCSGSMCVWGQCTVNTTKGDAGSICQYQSDCRPQHCCAFQRELLYPVCTPRPVKGEPCFSHPNLLMDMLAWDQDGPRDHCPCASGLHCQQHGRRSLCEK